MDNGEILRWTVRRRFAVGLFAVALAGTLAGCGPDEEVVAETPASKAPAALAFGSGGYGKLTLNITEKAAVATGDLQPDPVSTVLYRTVYSFTGGPAPDASRMAADEKIEKAVEKAEKLPADASAAEHADAAEAYAESADRMEERLVAYYSAGGATFSNGKLISIAAPEGITTDAGVKRGSTVAELQAAYQDKGLKKDTDQLYVMPVEGHARFLLAFEVEKDVVKYMVIRQRTAES